MGELPIYNATLVDDDCGMLCISLVDAPAVESNFLAFKQDRQVMMYAVQDEEQRKVLGVVMRADFPIYRVDERLGEFYIVYTRDVIQRMAEKYLAEYRQNEVNTMHLADSFVEGVQMTQWYIKDSAKGIVPAGFEDISDGSLFAEFHIHNEQVWEKIKSGEYKGFSLEGIFGVERVNNNLKQTKRMSKLSRLVTALENALLSVKCGSVTTDRGVLVWDGEDDLKEGFAVFVESPEGERTPAEDGDYATEDGKVIKVAEGKVAEIADTQAEVEAQEGEGEKPADEAAPKDEQKNAEEELDARLAELENRIAKLEALVGESEELRKKCGMMEERLSALETKPASKPAHEEFARTFIPKDVTGNRGLDNLMRKLGK